MKFAMNEPGYTTVTWTASKITDFYVHPKPTESDHLGGQETVFYKDSKK